MTCRRSMRGCVLFLGLSKTLILILSSPVQASLASSSTNSVHDFADNTPRPPCPPYIASAYKWLKNNLCKPYPSQADIRSISLDSKTSEKRLRNWFVSARQRIGWTKILKDHFHSDKTDASEAANYVFNQTHISTPVDRSIIRKFVKMQLAAEGMYAATFQPTQFVGSLGTTVAAMSPEHKAMLEQMRKEAIEEENVQREMNRLEAQKAAPRRQSQRRSASLYPSPEQSPEPTSSSSNIEDTEAELSIPTPTADRKRRRYSSPNEPDKRNKRAKCVTLSRTLSIHTYALCCRSGTTLTTIDPSKSLPSPALSREGSTDSTFNYWASSSEDLSEALQSSNTPSQQLNNPRKRRLSDADAHPAPPKRPRGFPVGPRFHTVSDPLPPPSNCLQTQIGPSDSEIFNSLYDPSIFEMPGPVTSHMLDSNEPLDISFFNNWTTSESTDYQPFSLSNLIASLAPSPISLHYADLPVSELSSLTAPGFDVMDNHSPTDTLDDFLQQLSQGSQFLPTLPSSGPVMQGFATPHSMPKTPAQTMANPWSQGMFTNQSNPKISSASGPGFVEFGNMISGSSSTMLGLSSALTPDEIIAQSEAAIRRAKLQKMESLRAELAALEQDTTA